MLFTLELFLKDKPERKNYAVIVFILITIEIYFYSIIIIVIIIFFLIVFYHTCSNLRFRI